MIFFKSKIPFLWKYKLNSDDKYHYTTFNKLIEKIGEVKGW